MPLPVAVGAVDVAIVDLAVEADTSADAFAFATAAAIAASDALVAAPFPVAHVAAAFAALAFDVDGPPLSSRIVDRSSLVKLELRVEKFPPSKPVAHAIRAGSWAC